MASGLRVKVQVAGLKTEAERGRGNNHSNRKPCPGKLRPTHTCKDTVHTLTLAGTRTTEVKNRGDGVSGSGVALKAFNCEHTEKVFC